MMYGVDSGGQAAFLDIAPALLRFHIFNMVVLRLDEKLDDTANFFYSVHGRKVGDGEKRQVSTVQLTKSFFHCKSQLRPPLLEGVENVQLHGCPHFIVVGTCYDKYKMLQFNNQLEESLEEKNERLRSELKNYEDVRIDYIEGKDVIFPIDTTSRSKHERHIAKRIRQITSQSYITAEVPARWFFFQFELKSKSMGRRVISLGECLEIGMSIGMQHKEVKAALWYFHNLSLYLYFPDILPNVVFLDPQFLFDNLSQLIAVSYGNDRYSATTIRRLKESGFLEREILDTLYFEDEIFSSDDCLKLMEGLLIIAKIPNDTGYFIPCVLNITDNPFEDVSERDAEPLIFTWKDEIVPNGLFTSLVVLLLRLPSPSYFQLGNDCYRNKIVLKCFGGIMHLVDQVTYLGIRYIGPKQNCFLIRQIVHHGIVSIVEKFGWKRSLASVQEGFHCKMEKCESHFFHFCHLHESQPILICNETGDSCVADWNRHLVWNFTRGI